MKRQIQLSIASLLASTAVFSAFTGSASASALDLVPQEQGEINVGLGCLEDCIELGSLFDSIVSLTDETTGSRSRLFVDYFGEGDVEQTFGTGDSKVRLKTRDAGTNSDGFWFRPSEYNESDGSTEEQGQLEVGTYLFNFAQEMAEMTFYFFDTESKNSTGVLSINGEAVAEPEYVKKGPDGNIVAQTFTNIKSATVKFGFDRETGTGDGVDFRITGTPVEPASVPEPATLLGLFAIAGAGLGLKRKASQTIG
ncbi:MAG: LEVG family PEP-CTERM protein [Cyanobacteria bacterium J06638_28]